MTQNYLSIELPSNLRRLEEEKEAYRKGNK